jgi:hypothetical protein
LKPVTGQTLPEPIVRELGVLLAAMVVGHEEYLGLLSAQREAVRSASPALAGEILNKQGVCLERLAGFEQTRRALVHRVIDGGHWPGRELVTLSGLAARAGASRDGLVEAAQKLRGLIAAVQKEQGVVRRVSQALSAHIEGLMRHVAQAASHAGTYGRRGVVGGAGTSAVVTAIDLRS